MEPVIKSPKVQRLESARGADIREIMRDTYARRGSVEGAAEELGISQETWHRWRRAFGLRREYSAPPAEEAAA